MIFASVRASGIALLLLLAGCGGGGGGGGSNATPTTPATPTPPVVTAAANTTPLVVDSGPAALATGSGAYHEDNLAYVSVTLCVPGTTTCQTIDHVEVDTGSVGLRIVGAALNAGLLNGLAGQTDAAANPVGECYGYVDGYAFGSVRQADFQIGGEKVANMPFQVIGDGGRFAAVPSQCSAGGGKSLKTVKDFGANGIIGLGVTATDCGADCAVSGGYAAAIYYDCPASGCAAIITRTAAETAPFQQLPNPVAAMAVDNNGTVLDLPSVSGNGQASASGTLYFGIGTQSNNGLGSAGILETSTDGAGLLTARYAGRDLPDSFIDSGSNAYVFADSAIAKCTGNDFKGFYCPASPVAISATIVGRDGATADGSFTLRNAQTLGRSNGSALPGIGASPDSLDNIMAYPDSFDFGLPFFYGRKVYTAIQGRTAGGTAGPYIAY